MIRPFEYEPLPSPEIRQHFVAESAHPLWIIQTSRLKRWESVPDMIHRTDLFTHYRRVAVITKNLFPIIDPFMPVPRQVKLFRMGYHHDDPEVGTGDIPTPVKMAMTKEEHDTLSLEEELWSSRIADFIFHFINPEDKDLYMKEQEEIKGKSTEDAQFLDIADKLDGLGETMHELYCGNKTFIGPLNNYRKRFESFTKYPIWDVLKNDPAIKLSTFPNPEDFPKDPTITPDFVNGLDNLWQLPRIPNLHPWYRSWLGITIQEFDLGRAKFLFPGWPHIWQRPEEPRVRTSSQGINLTDPVTTVQITG